MSGTDTPRRVYKVTLSGFSIGLRRGEKTWRLHGQTPAVPGANMGCRRQWRCRFHRSQRLGVDRPLEQLGIKGMRHLRSAFSGNPVRFLLRSLPKALPQCYGSQFVTCLVPASRGGNVPLLMPTVFS